MITPDPAQFPYLYQLRTVLNEHQWSALFGNRLAKQSAAQLLCKASGIKPTKGDLHRLGDAIAKEMQQFRPIKMRRPGDKFLMA